MRLPDTLAHAKPRSTACHRLGIDGLAGRLPATEFPVAPEEMEGPPRPLDRPSGPSSLLPLQSGARRHQRIVGWPAGVAGQTAVRGDGAVHQTGVVLASLGVGEIGVVGRAGLGALDQHVGPLQQLPEPFHIRAAFAGAGVEHDALLPPVPDPRARQGAGGVSTGGLDGQTARGHRRTPACPHSRCNVTL